MASTLLAAVPELRDELRDGHHEPQVASLDAIQHDRVRELLADRHRREHRVRLESPGARPLGKAAGGGQGDVAAARHADCRTVVTLGVDVGVDQVLDAGQALEVEAEILGVCLRHGLLL